MQKKQMIWKTKGMNRDLSVSAFNPEFSFENMNLRLSTNEGNTTLSWVNERGTAKLKAEGSEEEDITFDGIPVGTAVLNHKLIVFIAANDKNGSDYIYEFEVTDKENHTLKQTKLYKGHLNLSSKYPLETLASYESEEAQKVYWTDNSNQPRVINIAKFEENAREFKKNEVDTIFDFVPTVLLDEDVEITKIPQGNGVFAPGVIQYCLAYYNRYGQQTNIVYVSPLLYLAHPTRGASPEEKVGCSFKIRVENIDESFEYLRIYSVQRTSIDVTPIVKQVIDLKVANAESYSEGGEVLFKYLEFTDNGMIGAAMDPTELLFIGGKSIKVLTMAEKDKTLFMGNITQESLDVSKLQQYFLTNPNIPEFSLEKECSFEEPNSFYPYKNSIGNASNSEEITTFKGGEWYRFGFQLQRKTGEWSEPIYLGDRQNSLYPSVSRMQNERNYLLSLAKKEINFRNVADDLHISLEDYVKVRPLVVFPNTAERSVICQGVLNPTVFNVEDRLNGTPFAQPSWYFRPYSSLSSDEAEWDDISTNAEYRHYASLPEHQKIEDDIRGKSLSPNEHGGDIIKRCKNIEIQGSKNKYATSDGKGSVWGTDTGASSNTQFFVDQSIVTLNSPDIDFDTNVQNIPIEGSYLRIIGYIDIDSSASFHSITTSSNKALTGQNLIFDDDPGDPVPHISGEGELTTNILYNVGAGKNKGSRMIAGNIWSDGFSLNAGIEGGDLKYAILEGDPNWGISREVYETEGDDASLFTTHAWPVKFFIHPWHASRALNNDWRSVSDQSSVLKTKKVSNLLYSYKTCYFEEGVQYMNVNTKMHLQENEQIYKISLPRQKSTTSQITYYPNIDKILYNHNSYLPLYETASEEEGKRYPLTWEKGPDIWLYKNHWMTKNVSDAVEMKYKSTSHAVISLNSDSDGDIQIMPALTIKNYNSVLDEYGFIYGASESPTFWGDSGLSYRQPRFYWDIAKNEYDWENRRPKILWLGELYKDINQDSIFGGKTLEALKSNTWLIGGDPVTINKNSITNLIWNQGDTYYQRYDCLKTYPFTKEDKNQLVEILSFMCETHVNIDGRYDANRGQINNVNASPENFNLINDVYTQLNNFFTSRKVNTEGEALEYPNLITYSKTKNSAADVDLWTNVTLASTLELDGNKGQITSLKRFNDQIIAFQDHAVSQVLYNENAMISSTQGVPIELGNSSKVQGKRYLSDYIGCSNKWSITNTPAGIYFIDSNNKGIYVFDGSIKNLSGSLGFNAWCKNNIPNSKKVWNPEDFDNFVTYYDILNQDVLFINKDTCLAYSEKLGAFTSFYDYEDSPYFCNLDDVGIWLRRTDIDGKMSMWQHQAGDYCNFFGVNKPYWMTLVGNPDPQTDKIFTNLEFRANTDMNNPGDLYAVPFNNLEVWNEYQHGIANIDIRDGHSAMIHHRIDSNEASLKRKFRIWRCDIPRDNAPEDFDEDAKKGIYRTGRHPMDRMRNPWLYLKLLHSEAGHNQTLDRTEIHDMMMTYFE